MPGTRILTFLTAVLTLLSCKAGKEDESVLTIHGGVPYTSGSVRFINSSKHSQPGWGGDCTASFIAENLMVTAAHCFDYSEESVEGTHGRFRIVKKEVRIFRSESDVWEFTANTILVHSRWNGDFSALTRFGCVRQDGYS